METSQQVGFILQVKQQVNRSKAGMKMTQFESALVLPTVPIRRRHNID
jgi:hypothetical protein